MEKIGGVKMESLKDIGIEKYIYHMKSQIVNKLYKSEISIPIADLSVDSLLLYLNNKYQVVADRCGMTTKENAVRVVYASERSFIIKIKKNKKIPTETLLQVHNEFGDMNWKEKIEQSIEIGKKEETIVNNVVGGISKGIGKGIIGVGAAAVETVTGNFEGAKKSIDYAGKGFGNNVGQVVGDIARNSAKTKKEQLKLANEELKQAKETGDPEKLYSAYIRLQYLETGSFARLINSIKKNKAKKEWKLKEAQILPIIWEEILNEIKSNAGIK